MFARVVGSLPSVAIVTGCFCNFPPPVEPLACRTDDDCADDGYFCNGPTICVYAYESNRRYCSPSGYDPCAADERCDEASRSCLPLCEGWPECPGPDGGRPEPSCDPTMEGEAIGSDCAESCSAAGLVCVEGEWGRDLGPVEVQWRFMCTMPCGSGDGSESDCGECARCDDRVRVGDVRVEASELGRLTVCRPICEPTRDSTGCARFGYSCDIATGTCHDACRSDVECRLVRDETGALVLDDTREHVCDSLTGRCRIVGTPGARTGDRCVHDTDCADDGLCLRGDGWPAEGHCTRVDCQWPALACDEGEQCHHRALERPVCLRACVVGADADDLRLGDGGHGEGCLEELSCRWDGVSGASGPNGGCMPGNYNAVVTANVGAPCTRDEECYSPYGLGRCAFAEVGRGACTVVDCHTLPDGRIGVRPGVATSLELCDPTTTACVDLTGDSLGWSCVRRCTAASDCADGHACVALREGSVCVLRCAADAQCRPGERCGGDGGCDSDDCRCEPI